MKKIHLLFITISLIISHLSSIEAKSSKPKKWGNQVNQGRQVKDHDGNDWPDWGKLD